jgi:hypothetical protein
MKTQNERGRGKRKFTQIVLAVALVLSVANLLSADLVFDTGHNTFDDSYPYYNEVWVINDAVLDVTGGSMSKLELTDSARANIYDGEIEWLFIQDNTVVNIHAAGDTLEMFAGGNSSLANLYAYNVIYHSTGGVKNEGWLEGKYYLNDQTFAFSFYTEDSYSHISIIPEPTTLLLVGFGSLLMIRLKKK